MFNRLIIFVIAVIALIFGVLSEIVPIQNCPKTTNCVVNQVTIDPCKEALSKRPCQLKRGKEANMTVEYTPNFESQNLTSVAYWDNGFIPAPLPNMDRNACKTAPCPVLKNTRQSYNFKLSVSKTFPMGTFPVKWRITGDNSEDECCFLMGIQLK